MSTWKSCGSSVLMLVAVFLSGNSFAQGFFLCEGGKPKATLVVGDKCTPVEMHAAKELAKYAKLIVGAEMKICREAENHGLAPAVLIGTPASHSLIRKLFLDGQLALSAAEGTDAFVIKTLADGERTYLAIAGQRDRACLYGVYHLLETFFDVGFFWDGEYVPKRKVMSIPVPTDVVMIPHFPIRQYLQECAFSYSCRAWSMKEWARELDWAAKKKFNTVMIPELHWCYNTKPEQIATYAKSIGLRPVFLSHGAGWWGVGDKYRKEHPTYRYVKMNWWGDPPYWTIHPREQAFVERGRQRIRPYVQKYGKGNVYCVDCYGEQTIHLPPAETRQLRVDFAHSVWKAIHAEDPEGRWVLWTWPFISPPWPTEDVKAFMEALPSGRACMFDAWAEKHPVYKKYNYFYGKDWGFSVLHLFGGDDSLRGNLGDLTQRVKNLVADPKAERCIGYYICPEIIHYNTLYFELAAALGWSPDAVDMDRFLDNYALRRYGRKSFSTMRLCLRKLSQSVYGQSPGSDALYQKRFANPTTALVGTYLLDRARALRNIPSLREGLEIGLRESNTQKGNFLYERDMVDLFRQYATELFNYHFLQVLRCAVDRDTAGFKTEARIVRTIFDAQARVLSVFPMYHIKPILDAAKESPQAPADVQLRIKDGMFTFARSKWLIDYQAKDMYELMKLYYGRRLSIYLDAVQKSIKTGTSVDDKDLHKEYKKVEVEWLQKPIDIPKKEVFRGSALDAVRKGFEEIRKYAPTLADRPISGEGVSLGNTVLWRDEFEDTAKWKIRHFKGGTFVSKDGIGVLQSSPKEGIVFGTAFDIPCKARPVLSFKAKCVKRHSVEFPLLTLWLTWLGDSGVTRRSRVWQEKDIPDGHWFEERIDIEAVLSIIGSPSKLKAVEVELPSNQTVEFGWIRITSGE